MLRRSAFLFFFLAVSLLSSAQNSYRYRVNLAQVDNDRLAVELDVPALKKGPVDFHLPRIIPGTYRISDYGRYVSELKAWDKVGRALPVKQTGTNTWRITNGEQLHRLTYLVDDTYDKVGEKDIYSMSGTNIEAGKNFVLNPFGFFGYFEGYRNQPFELIVRKPEKFYGATVLKPIQSNDSVDVYRTTNLDHFYDSPIMYSLPDTTTIKIANADVLVAVYSARKRVQAGFIAQNLKQLLAATAKYLGGRLPVDRYAFLFYFNTEQPAVMAMPGALEHNASSFYSMPEMPQQQVVGLLMDIAAHEFLHVVTPLSLSSREVKEFNFTEPVLSRHLWLYEGSTEYGSDHVQVKYGLNSVQQFLDKLSEKLVNSKGKYNDTLAFTRLSKESAGRYRDEYPNVYEKGALIAAVLDIYITHLTKGGYDLQKLKHDLSVQYGKDRYFSDDALFDQVAALTHQDVRTFFRRYVEGNEAIPYADYFALAGIRYMPEKTTSEITMGGIPIAPNQQGKVIILDVSKMNEFGRKMGYQQNDEVISINNKPVTPANLQGHIAAVKAQMKAGDQLSVTVVRKNSAGTADTVRLSSSIVPITTTKKHALELMEDPTPEQVLVRNAWLSTPERSVTPQAKWADVSDIDAMMKALYDVISGPAGKRNWERFRSLFYPGASMAAAHHLPNGQSAFNAFSTEDYIRNNGPFFEQNGFFEEEIGRKVERFGNVASIASAYQFRLKQQGPVEQRGVNFINLVYDKGRWWIKDILWQDESAANPIPEALLQKQKQ